MTSTDPLGEAAKAQPLNRQQILHTTHQCLQQYGFERTTIRRIAAMLGCAIGSIYRHFPNKNDLLLTVTQQLIEPVQALAEQGAPFAASARAYATVALSHHESYRLMFWLACESPAAGDSAGEAAPAAVLPPLVQRIIEHWGEQLGDHDQAQRNWAYLHGAVMLGHSPERILRTLEEMDGLHRRSPASHAAPLPVPQIVMVMKEPPPPRTLPRPAEPAREEAAAPAAPAVEPEGEDVCLL